MSGKTAPRGDIVSTQGEKLGEHEGIYNYTVGQRKGLGLSNPHPLYVLSIDEELNQVRVGAREDLAREGFIVEGANWLDGAGPTETARVRAKLRYRHQGVLCDVTPLGEGRCRVTFVSDWSAVSPGQAAVFYKMEPEEDGARELLGGGIISKDLDESST